MRRSRPLRRSPLRSSRKPIPRYTALPRAKTPIARTAKPKARRVPKRFAHLRLPAFLDWIKAQPCVITGKVTGEWVETRHGWVRIHVDPAHVRTRAVGAPDLGNVVPLARHLHDEQHMIGIKSFERKHGLDLRAIARELEARYTHEQEGWAA